MAEIIALIAGLLLLLFWIYLLFLRPIFRIVARYLSYGSEMQAGREVSGQVIASNVSGVVAGSSEVPVSITVEFENLSGSPVQSSFHFRDTRPAERRFDKGRPVRLRLNGDAPPGRQILLSGSVATLNPGVLLPFVALFLGLLAGLFWGLETIWSSNGNNIDQLLGRLGGSSDWQESGILFLVTLILLGALFWFLGAKFSRSHDDRLRLYGRAARARITGMERTGVRVNNLPVVRFDYEFTTSSGAVVSGSERKTVDILEAGKIHELKEKEILYLPDQPDISAWLEHVNKPSSGPAAILKGVFYFMFFIFSCIYLGQLLYLLWPAD